MSSGYLPLAPPGELSELGKGNVEGVHEVKDRRVDRLEAEIAMVAGHLGGAHPVTQVHWGGGSPTILKPDDTLRLRGTVLRHFPRAREDEFAVEIDPRDMSLARLDALAEAGLTRASIGVQDFDERVQQAIGRHQGYEMTRDVIAGLRERKVI